MSHSRRPPQHVSMRHLNRPTLSRTNYTTHLTNTITRHMLPSNRRTRLTRPNISSSPHRHRRINGTSPQVPHHTSSNTTQTQHTFTNTRSPPISHTSSRRRLSTSSRNSRTPISRSRHINGRQNPIRHKDPTTHTRPDSPETTGQQVQQVISVSTSQ